MSKAKETAREPSPIHATFVTRRNAPSDGFLFLWGPDDTPETDWLGQLRRIGLTGIPSSRLYPAQARLFLPARDGRYRIDTVSGRALRMGDAVRVLATASFAQPKRDTRNKRKKAPCPSIIAWSCVAKFSLELIARAAFIPTLKTNGHNLYAVWQAAIENSVDIGRIRQLASLMPICAHALYSIPHNRWDKANKLGSKRRKPTMMWHPEALVRAFIDAAIDSFVRSTKLPDDVASQTHAARESLRLLERPKASMPLIEKLVQEYPQNFDAICEQNEHYDDEKPISHDQRPKIVRYDDDDSALPCFGDDSSIGLPRAVNFDNQAQLPFLKNGLYARPRTLPDSISIEENGRISEDPANEGVDLRISREDLVSLRRHTPQTNIRQTDCDILRTSHDDLAALRHASHRDEIDNRDIADNPRISREDLAALRRQAQQKANIGNPNDDNSREDLAALRRQALRRAQMPDPFDSHPVDLSNEYELQDVVECDMPDLDDILSSAGPSAATAKYSSASTNNAARFGKKNEENSLFSSRIEDNATNRRNIRAVDGEHLSKHSDINESASFGFRTPSETINASNQVDPAPKAASEFDFFDDDENAQTLTKAPESPLDIFDSIEPIDEIEGIDDIEALSDEPQATPYSPTEAFLATHPIDESTPSQLPLNASNLPDTGLESQSEVSIGFPVKMTQDQMRKLMPMKEFVYTTPQELDAIPRWESRWIDALLDKKTHSRIDYHLDDPDLVDSITSWLAPMHDADAAEDVDAHAGFWLEAPTAESGDFWFLRYMLVAIEDPSIAIRAGLVFSIGTEKLRIDRHFFDNPQEQLLADLGKAAPFFEPIKKSLEQSKPEGVFLDVKQAWTFISEVSPILYSSGFDVRLPEQLTDQGSRRLRARFRIRDASQSDAARGHFGLTEIAGFQWEAALGDEVVSAKEFHEIVALKQPLVQWHGEWVLVDPVQLRDIELLIDQNETQGVISRFDAINRALTGVADPNSPNSNIEVVVEGKIADILSRLTKEDITDMTLKAPDTFCGTLRPYQERGVAWLSYQSRLGLGCCLADDMGLGKTIQLICHILHMKKRSPSDRRGILLICPMSVVGNWKREFARFAPSVHVVIHHGNDRAQCTEDWLKNLEIPGTVVITTYGLIHRNADFLYTHRWAMIALDEAQAIKNASSKRSILVRELQADFRVALTGTPIENRLSELWSILDFLNPGLLGTHTRFQRLYGVPIERNNDEKAKERLRNVVAPFILRRVKSDPQIIQDLPEKMENKIFCSLSREQATLYQALVNTTMEKIEHAEGIARHGQILALLTHLKQIVDHPALFQKASSKSPDRSGKILRLIDMLETIIENDERALIFTQFKEMGDLLVPILQDAFDLETIPFLHGGLTASQRDALVADFQSPDGPPIFILSLKAGGTGLNLTAASHVFHFDRWWNPAVEDQATDRAYRIGQNKNVQVHKFLTLGTLEEKIDLMLEEKKNLSDAIVDASGAWVSQLDADALRELFTLSSEAMIDENA